MSKTVGSEWDSYREEVLPKDAGSTQVTETCNAFYAGAVSMRTMMHEALSSDDDLGARLTAIDKELQQWITDRIRQRELYEAMQKVNGHAEKEEKRCQTKN